MDYCNTKNRPSFYVDLGDEQYQSVNSVSQALRPDIVLVRNDTVYTLELTICHESNYVKANSIKLINTLYSRIF